MSIFIIGLSTGIFIGIILGWTLCALMVVAKREDRRLEKEKELYSREGET